VDVEPEDEELRSGWWTICCT